MQATRYLAIVRTSAWYDLLVTWPFATPWTYVWLYGTLSAWAQTWGLPGAIHPIDATHVMLANLLGSVVVVWSVARICAPSIPLGRLDGVARWLFAAWQINAFLSGANALVLMFTLAELVFGVLQWWPIEQRTTSARADR